MKKQNMHKKFMEGIKAAAKLKEGQQLRGPILGRQYGELADRAMYSPAAQKDIAAGRMVKSGPDPTGEIPATVRRFHNAMVKKRGAIHRSHFHHAGQHDAPSGHPATDN